MIIRTAGAIRVEDPGGSIIIHAEGVTGGAGKETETPVVTKQV